MRRDIFISIHAPVKGATPYPRRGTRPGLYFNPRTREGCDGKVYVSGGDGAYISIHAPVKGATGQVRFFIGQEGRISIHAPVKGATAFKLAQSLSALSSIILRTD